jgi:hypothetical protein
MAEVFHRYVGKDGKMPKLSPQERKEQSRRSKLAAELTDERAQAVRVNRMRGEMLLAKARGELIMKELVERQAAYLLIPMRQRILALPQTYARRLTGIDDAKVMSEKLCEIALSLLNELQHLPEKVTGPNWLDRLEEEEKAV